MKIKITKYSLWILFITLLGAVLRIYGFGDIPFSHDELSVEGRLHFRTFSELIEHGVKTDGHPAGIQVFLWFWCKLFGYSEIAIRLPFLLMGIACIPLSYLAGQKFFNKSTGLFVSAFIATSQYAIMYSIYARPYIAGCFFALLLLLFWKNIVSSGIKPKWRDSVLFGICAAACAYIHQFAMYFAFLVAVTGFLFCSKKKIWYYLVSCGLAILLYLPHIPLLIHQIGLGGVGGWLGKPRPDFLIKYIAYLLHFSRIMYISIVAILVVLLVNYIKKPDHTKNKLRITVFLWFLISYITGFLYSSYISPVLQYSVLIFSFPCLLLFVFSFTDEKLTRWKQGLLALLMVSMTCTLIFERRHYELMKKIWYEASVKETITLTKEHPGAHYDCCLRLQTAAINYYENKYGITIPNLTPGHLSFTPLQFRSLLASLKSDYMIAAGLFDMEYFMIQEFYPYLIRYVPCIGSEIYIYSRNKPDKVVQFPYTFHKTIDLKDRQLDSLTNTFPLFSMSYNEIAKSRYSLGTVSLDFTPLDSSANILLVLETIRKDSIIDWRAFDSKDYIFNADSCNRMYNFFRYELLFKSKKEYENTRVNVYLWNIHKQDNTVLHKATITFREDNNIIYGLGEPFK